MDLEARPGLLTGLFDQDFDGMTVRGVLTPEEARRAADAILVYTEHRTAVVFGTVSARPLLQGGRSRDRTEHLDDAERFRTAFPCSSSASIRSSG